MNQVTLQSKLSSISDAGIKVIDSFTESIAEALYKDKLLLIYFHDPASSNNNFVKVLLNNDINSLFNLDFVIHISNAQHMEQEFTKYFKDTPDNMANKLMTIGVRSLDKVEHVSTIDVLNTDQEVILYELYKLNTAFQEQLLKENDETIEQCAKVYLDTFAWLDKNDYPYVSLKDVLDITMNQPLPHLRKILMVYMYKEGSALTKQFNFFLESGVLNKYNPLMIPVFWNISDVRYHKALKFACQRYFEQDVLEKTVSSQEGGVFFFMPDERSICSTPRIFTKITSSDEYTEISYLIESLDYIFSDFQEINKITDFYEIDAIDTYLTKSNKLLTKYIVRRSLHDIAELCLQVPRKMLLLYFYKSESKFQSTLPRVRHLLHKEQVILLPWDITNSAHNEHLIRALQRAFGLKKIEQILKAQKSALFMFLPIGNTLVLHSVLEDDASVSEIEKAYKASHKFLMLESELSDDIESDAGPAAYQQVMCDQLGDRDFDCFQLERGEDKELKSKIGFAYFGPPNDEKGYDKNQDKQINTAYKKILSEAAKLGENDKMLYISFMRVCIMPLPDEKHKKMEKDVTYQPALDFNALPLFGIRKCFNCPASNSACRKYIDHIGRTYETWEHFLEDNKYPKVMLIAPKNGKYTCDYRGHVQLEVCMSPACGIGVAVLKGFDIGVGIAGGVVGVVGVATSFIALPVLPFVAMGAGVGVGIYSIVRSGMILADRVKHGESMSLSSAEARGAYLNILAGSLGFTTAGASFALSYAARSGVNIGMGARAVMNGITIANLTAGGAALTNSAYDVIKQWSEDGRPNALALVQLSSSVLFFGHAVYNTQFAGTIVRNAQATSINEILDSLSSNRQRKTVLRLINSTADQVGSTSAANAEVIRYMRNIDNIQEVVGVLTRDTRMMSRNGVRYSVENQKIVFNGVEMNVSEFGNMSKLQRSDLITSISGDSSAVRQPGSPVKVSKTNFLTIERILDTYRTASPFMKLMLEKNTTMEKLNELINVFSPYIQRQLLMIMGKFLNSIGHNSNKLFCSLSSLYPAVQLPLRVMDIIIQFYKGAVDEKTKESMPTIDFIIKSMEKIIIISSMSMAGLLVELTTFCSKWVVQAMIKLETDADLNGATSTRAIKHCDRCNGNYYQS